VTRKKCVGCGDCVEHCSQSAISLQDEKAKIDTEKCIGCGECILICSNKAIDVQWNADAALFQKKMAEYAMAVLRDKKQRSAFLNFLTHISPACDCYGHNDAPIVHDIGVMASTDPVAIEQASVDMVNHQEGVDGSCLTTNREAGGDKFRAIYPNVDWTIQLDHAQKIGLGQREYELITI
jgi:uncharacterized Fe-S center protein